MVRTSFTSWLNQKIANVLGDFKKEREAEEDPSPTRAVCRIVFVIILMIGFLLLLVYYFIGSPDVWVEQISLSEHKDFARCSLYETDNCKDSPPNYATQRNPVVCPCNHTSVRWRDFVRFYILYENSTEWTVTSGIDNSTGANIPWINVPTLTEANYTLLKNHIVRNEKSLTSDAFCSLARHWPLTDAAISMGYGYGSFVCHYMASTLLPADPGSNYSRISENRTTEVLESPNLLNREVFNVRVAERARESVLRGRLDLDIFNFADDTFWRTYNLYANLFTRVLDRFETEEWKSYYLGALDLSYNLKYMVDFRDKSPWVIYLNDEKPGLIFLHFEIDWKGYYNACEPLYCEETKKMSRVRQAYRAFGLLGGVTTLVLASVTVVLWPGFALLLSWCCKKPTVTASERHPEHPKAALLSSIGLPDPLSQEPNSSSVVSGPVASLELHRRMSQKRMEVP